MAIYSLHAKIIGRGQKKSTGTVSLRTVVAAAAYRAGEQLRNLADGMLYDFSRKQGVVHTEILLPEGAPERYRDRQTLWNEVEAMERRHDAQFCREITLALPVELTREQNLELARQYIQRQFVNRGMCADFAFHDPDPKSGQKNPHVHVMLTMRDLQAHGFGLKNRDWNQKELLERWRERWAAQVNDYLAQRGIASRIDHRSLKAQGLDRAPTVHLGVEVTAMERRGIRTEKGNLNRSIRAHNAARDCGIETPTILVSINNLWQRAAQRRRSQEVAAASMPVAGGGRQPEQEDGDSRSGVQRRTYTLHSNVVRQGSGPAPGGDGENALRGDKNEEAHPPPRGQEASPSGGASRQPAPVELERGGLLQRVAAWFGGEDKQPRLTRGEALYDIKVTAAALSRLAGEGIENYDALERKVSQLSQQVNAGQAQLLHSSQQIGIAKACAKAYTEAAQLRLQLKEAEQLHGAVLRCQANQKYAQEYASKVLFKENYYKKYAEKIDAFAQAAQQLKAAGMDSSVPPVQLLQPVESLKKQLATTHRKYLWLAEKLKDAGCPAQPTPPQLEQLILTLEQTRRGQKETVTQLQKEHWQWKKTKDQIDNVLQGRPAKSPGSPGKPSTHER